MAAKKSASKQKLETAMREVFTDEPSTVTRANVSPERKRKMKGCHWFSRKRVNKAHVSPKEGLTPWQSPRLPRLPKRRSDPEEAMNSRMMKGKKAQKGKK